MYSSSRHVVGCLRVAPVLALVAMLAGCTSGGEMASPLAPTGAAAGAGGHEAEAPAFAAELALCADEINRYRAGIGLRPLVQSTVLQAFAASAAQNDGTTYVAHQFFRSRNGGGVALAETEILWWRGFSVSSVIRRGLAQMWQVGPRGEHYEILAGPYTEVGCGVFVNGSEVTVTQSFR